MVANPQQMHGFRNDTDLPATLKVTATPAGDLDRILRTLCGLSRDGLLVPGKPPRHPLVMASLAYRGRYYAPPLPRWLYWTPIGGMAPLGAQIPPLSAYQRGVAAVSPRLSLRCRLYRRSGYGRRGCRRTAGWSPR
jgi:hypothetical protein